MTQPKTDRVQHESENPMDARIEQLKQLFPEAVSEDGINLDTLRNLLGIQFPQKERYSFTWAGKQDAILSLQKRSKATLKPVPEESVNWDSTGHLFIEGDNLEVLKLLYKSYFGRVKMIYIDPPYNTGNDFIYPDDYTEPLENYLRLTGQTDENGTRYSSRMEMNGRKHSAWLSMMYPRLFLARQLLRDDGVIFVSIDDNEIHNLRMIMNEIFGEENFLGAFIWKRRTGSNDSTNFVSIDHEYVIAYTKTANTMLNGMLKDFANYSNPDGDPRGPWAVDNLTCNKTKEERPNLYYSITDPITGNEFEANPNRVWVYEKKRMQELINSGKVIFPSKKDGVPKYKRHQSEVRSDRKPVSTWIESTANYDDIVSEQFEDGVSILQVPLNAQATKDLRALLNSQIFSYPKHPQLIKEFLKQATNKDDNDIVLDFFAGSASTAHAVLEMNREDGGNRRFIMVQLPEPTDNPAYPTIADIGKERIRRVIQRMTDSEAGKLEGFKQYPNADLGFRVFRLDTSPLRQWEDMPPDTTPDEYIRQMDLFVYEPLLEGWQVADVIAEVALKELGFNLTYRVEHVPSIQELTIYKVTDDEKGQSFYICLDDKITVEAVKPLGLTQDDLFVFRDTAITDTVILNLRLLSRILAI